MPYIETTKSILADLISFPTVSDKSNLAIIDYIRDHFTRVGARVEVTKNAAGDKANLYAVMGDFGVAKGVMLSGHTDVVPVDGQKWSFESFKLTESNDRLYGRGTCDMKGFIAIVLALLPHFASRSLACPLHFIFTYDEEVGLLGAKHFAETLLKNSLPLPGLAIIGEPTLMSIIDSHKGYCKYTTFLKGSGGHSSNPLAGVSAVEYGIRYANHLIELANNLVSGSKTVISKQNFVDFSTLHIGKITGGSAHNVIATDCSLDWELRPVKDSDKNYITEGINAYSKDKLLPLMRSIFADSDILLHLISDSPAYNAGKNSAAREMIMKLTGTNSCYSASFATEAAIFEQIGISSIVCGPGNIAQAHQPDEYIEISQLSKSIDILLKLSDEISSEING